MRATVDLSNKEVMSSEKEIGIQGHEKMSGSSRLYKAERLPEWQDIKVVGHYLSPLFPTPSPLQAHLSRGHSSLTAKNSLEPQGRFEGGAPLAFLTFQHFLLIPHFNAVLSMFSPPSIPLSQDWELEHSDSIFFVFKF